MRATKILVLALAAVAVGSFAVSGPALARGGGGGGGGHGGGGGGHGGGNRGSKSGRGANGSKSAKTNKKDIEIGREKLRQIDYRDHDAGTDRGPA